MESFKSNILIVCPDVDFAFAVAEDLAKTLDMSFGSARNFVKYDTLPFDATSKNMTTELFDKIIAKSYKTMSNFENTVVIIDWLDYLKHRASFEKNYTSIAIKLPKAYFLSKRGVQGEEKLFLCSKNYDEVCKVLTSCDFEIELQSNNKNLAHKKIIQILGENI